MYATLLTLGMPVLTQLELFGHSLESMKMNFNIIRDQHNHQI
jgi:hypothetical protein